MGGGGGGREAGEAAEVWAAAGVEHARAASGRQCAALDACWHAWTAKAASGEAMLKAADANGRVGAGAGNRVSRGAIAEAAAAMRQAIDAMDRAAVEFRQTANLSSAAADGWARAEESLVRAGLAGRGRAARDRSDEARRMTQTMEALADQSRASADRFREAADGWVAYTADWEDGDEIAGDRSMWLARRGEVEAVVDDERARAVEMARRTQEAARLAEGELARITADSKMLTAAAVGKLEGLDEPDAEAALRKGMEEARRAVRDR